jgi:beta-glucosidase/6-phospho-beta-glucosidase/beta-galactosidase
MASRNPAGIQYYHNLIDELIKYNIEPMVTLYHWDLPQGLHEKGGWENDTIINYFNDYARAMFQEYGDKVRVTPYFFLAQITFVLQSNLHMFSSLVNSIKRSSFSCFIIEHFA